ncbi:MAG: 5'/3'-nucleotidase SurE [Chloroflexota bacterium]
MRVRRLRLADGTDALTSDGAPSDCVALAVMGLMQDKIDLIVSGINPAPNLGHDVTYSGTVTAVMEGIIWGIPGVAISMEAQDSDSDDLDYTTAVQVASRL